MSAVLFVMYRSRISNWIYFDYVQKMQDILLGKEFRALTSMRDTCKVPADGYHGPYLIKEIDHHNDEWEKLRTYVNTLTPEQLKELKI